MKFNLKDIFLYKVENMIWFNFLLRIGECPKRVCRWPVASCEWQEHWYICTATFPQHWTWVTCMWWHGLSYATTVKSTTTMASARSISSNVRYILKSSITKITPLESQKSARSVTMKAIIHGMKRNKDNISFLELGAVKLREGSYNDVFLISSIHSLLVEKSSGLHSTHLGHQFKSIWCH